MKRCGAFHLPIERRVSNDALRSAFAVRPGFTLIEMVVVVAIVLVLLGIALPSVNSMWAQHRENDANNGISGMLMSTRAKAIQGDRGEVGLFFYLDGKGTQQIALITRDPRIEPDPDATPSVTPPNWRTDKSWQNVFTIAQDGGRSLIAPMRVVPRYVVDDEPQEQSESWKAFSATELANEDFENVAALPIDNRQRHRNYFAMVFSPTGELQFQRDVLIRDPDEDGDGKGDVTGIAVSDDVTAYYTIDGRKVADADLFDIASTLGPGGTDKLDLIAPPEATDTALNFPSVDGVMVYDDSAFKSAGDAAQKREVLLEIARPYYVHRMSGTVVKGPVGEVAGTQVQP